MVWTSRKTYRTRCPAICWTSCSSDDQDATVAVAFLLNARTALSVKQARQCLHPDSCERQEEPERQHDLDCEAPRARMSSTHRFGRRFVFAQQRSTARRRPLARMNGTALALPVEVTLLFSHAAIFGGGPLGR